MHNIKSTKMVPAKCTILLRRPNSHSILPEMIGSMQRILAQNVGEYVVIEFLIGTGQIMRKQGLLYNVATSFVVLYDDAVTNFIVCDIFSVKFVYFYLPGERPNHNFNILRDSNVAPYSTSNSNMRNQRR